MRRNSDPSAWLGSYEEGSERIPGKVWFFIGGYVGFAVWFFVSWPKWWPF